MSCHGLCGNTCKNCSSENDEKSTLSCKNKLNDAIGKFNITNSEIFAIKSHIDSKNNQLEKLFKKKAELEQQVIILAEEYQKSLKDDLAKVAKVISSISLRNI